MLCIVVVNESEVIYTTILYSESELFNNHANNNSIHCLYSPCLISTIAIRLFIKI